MQFLKPNVSAGEVALATVINQSLLKGTSVLWVISGGSNIAIAVQVMEKVSEEGSHLLTIMLADERYGEVGHANSNAYQLDSAGFNPKAAHVIPVLIGKPITETTERYNQQVKEQFARHQVIIGQFGVGSDGHIAGILPNSAAATETEKLVTSYLGDDFSRISLTFPALRQLTAAYVFAYGAAKQEALRRLKDETLSLNLQPAQILKAIASTYIYNDELEGVAEAL